MPKRNDCKPWRLSSAVLALFVVAVLPSVSASQETGRAVGPVDDPILEIYSVEQALRLDWSLYSEHAWPVMVLPVWRYDSLTGDSLRLGACRASRVGDKAVHAAQMHSVEMAAAAVNARIRSDLDACEESQPSDKTLEIVLFTVGGIAVGVGVGILIGAFAL
jgi:hypothetical protein